MTHMANWKITTMLLMGKSTISTGPFSIANCHKLPEGSPLISINMFHTYFPLVNKQFAIENGHRNS